MGTSSNSYIIITCDKEIDPEVDFITLRTDPPQRINLKSGENFLTVADYPALKYGFEHKTDNILYGQECNIRKIDLSHFDGSQMTSMSYMFAYIYAELILDNLNTSNVTDMRGIFDYSDFEYLKPDFNVDKVTQWGSFGNVDHIGELDLTEWKTKAKIDHIAVNIYGVRKLVLDGWKLENREQANFFTNPIGRENEMCGKVSLKGCDKDTILWIAESLYESLKQNEAEPIDLSEYLILDEGLSVIQSKNRIFVLNSKEKVSLKDRNSIIGDPPYPPAIIPKIRFASLVNEGLYRVTYISQNNDDLITVLVEAHTVRKAMETVVNTLWDVKEIISVDFDDEEIIDEWNSWDIGISNEGFLNKEGQFDLYKEPFEFIDHQGPLKFSHSIYDKINHDIDKLVSWLCDHINNHIKNKELFINITDYLKIKKEYSKNVWEIDLNRIHPKILNFFLQETNINIKRFLFSSILTNHNYLRITFKIIGEKEGEIKDFNILLASYNSGKCSQFIIDDAFLLNSISDKSAEYFFSLIGFKIIKAFTREKSKVVGIEWLKDDN